MRLLALMVLGWIACPGIILASDGSLSVQENDERNAGYYLLHHLLDQESDVDKIMLIKNAPPEIGHFTKDISALAKESMATLDQLQSADKAIDFEQNPLPRLEIEVRKSIAADKQHQLIFATSGPAFVRALVVSQIEAANYAKHLAQVLAEHESGQTSQALEKMSDKWAREVDKAYALLGSADAH